MDYYLNEYSLRGQFKDVEEFFVSLRTHTLPALKKIEMEEESIIWKKDTFWQSEICNGITLTGIPRKKNERTEYLTLLQNQLIKLAYEEPFWESDSKSELRIQEYKFDEEYRDNFSEVNCFIKAIENEGRIVSFIHPDYKDSKLPVIVNYDDCDVECNIDNIIDESWWKNQPQINTWNISGKYIIQVRAKEFEYHPPHFHAISNEYAAVFKLSNGELYKEGKKKWTTQMIAVIQEWYHLHRDELQEAWDNLHGS